ncbi:hypothetical protein FGG08_000846 [Glutinoglossum americanum]|uniref:DNA-directed RNA polymerase subunit n=1 Tax=Glutinoglossum americanum TaxID=1670608 RepID=A0A9P8ICG2_9PEZI|nr:hypothetical protein FGG08_000846 [Glutinoglossum americanum]
MFILSTLSDLIQITPEDFQKRSAEALEDNINQKYANKVIQQLGLCICMWDLYKSSDALIGHGTGIVHVNVRLDFFDDIFVPPHLLFEGSYFDHTEQTWVWQSDSELFYFDKNETVRFRVENEHWNDQSPTAQAAERDVDGALVVGERRSPYGIEVLSLLIKYAHMD